MRFAVRRNPKRLQTILILALAFAVFSGIAVMVAGRETGMVLLVASGVILIFFALEQGKVGWYYEIHEGALIVRRTFRSYAVPGASIVKVNAIRWPAVRELLQRYRERKQVALGRLIGFCSLSIPLRGPADRERFVVLTRSGDREYILSPADPEAFVKECQRLMSRTQ
ncbi:MAG: hypothetical protein ACOCU4_08160 [Alkalispirochaeta sp.]